MWRVIRGNGIPSLKALSAAGRRRGTWGRPVSTKLDEEVERTMLKMLDDRNFHLMFVLVPMRLRLHTRMLELPLKASKT